MTNEDCLYWSKSSVYLKAIRDKKLHCCISTFYKYCRLLGFNARRLKKKSDDYNPVKTTKPNELWRADVTIFKTADGVKHYIHFLIDHFSKMILGYRVEAYSSGKAIRDLLQDSTLKYKPEKLTFLTDGGSENVNTTVPSFLNDLTIPTKHNIAQKDVVFSNSMIEAINKIMKHQFLYPKNTNSRNLLLIAVDESVPIYNTIRPQMSLGGNTPFETLNGVTIDINKYKASFVQQKTIRLALNKKNSCRICF
jgi:putative transposase